MNSPYRLGQSRVELWLNGQDLSPQETGEWRFFLEYASRQLGVRPDIRLCDGDRVLDEKGGHFAVIGDSSALTRKLFLNVPRIIILPKAGPSRVDGFFYWKRVMDDNPARQMQAMPANKWQPCWPEVTLISSVFRGDTYLDGFLKNAAKLENYAQCQHLLIRAASPGREHDRLVEHVRQHPGAIYINLTKDPGLYETWNIGTRLATGRYLSNANLDDRRAPSHLTVLKAVLDTQNCVDVASTALRISTERNLSWDASDTCRVMFAEGHDRVYTMSSLFKPFPTSSGLASRNLPHCMPLWRRSLHARIGYFDEKQYGPSADWALWLRAGEHGSLFHHTVNPLGLYLRDDESYWRRNPTREAADQRIVAEFGPQRSGLQGERKPFARQPLAMAYQEALAALSSGAAHEGLCGLMRSMMNEPSAQKPLSPGWAAGIAHHWCGSRALPQIALRFTRSMSIDRNRAFSLRNTLADLIHDVDPDASSPHAAMRVQRVLELACLDLFECERDLSGLLMLGLLARKKRNYAGERLLLKCMHDSDPPTFWRSVQSAYRFTRSLEALMDDLKPEDRETTASPSQQTPAAFRLIYYPAYKGNTYQQLLYAPMIAGGAEISGTSNEEAFLNAAPRAGCENVLHIHWVNRLFNAGVTTPGSDACNDKDFLAGLERQKKAGFKIYWTIHNRISHEAGDATQEIQFRRTLYLLADKVFIHHPLAAYLLDWQPDHAKIQVYEHGHYSVDQDDSVSRDRARMKMGISPNAFVITHIGQVRDYKGLGEVLPVILNALNDSPNMVFVIAGRIMSPGVKQWLEAHHHPRLVVRNEFVPDEELHLLMRASSLGFLAYHAVLTSGSHFHWLTCGRPVIAPPKGTIPAYLVDGWNGFFYDTAGDLGDLLLRVARLPSQEIDEMSENARLTAGQLKWQALR